MIVSSGSQKGDTAVKMQVFLRKLAHVPEQLMLGKRFGQIQMPLQLKIFRYVHEEIRQIAQTERLEHLPLFFRCVGNIRHSYTSSMYRAYSSAVIKSERSSSSHLISTIHPSSYGDSLINSGLSSSFSFTATTVPETGA